MSDAQAPAVETEIPVILAPAVRAKLALAVNDNVAERVRPSSDRAPDPTLWGPAGTPEISNRLGWLTIAERMLGQLDDLEAFVQAARADGLDDVVLLGPGEKIPVDGVVLESTAVFEIRLQAQALAELLLRPADLPAAPVRA